MEVQDFRDRLLSVIKAYYWATPIFLLLDLLFGIDVRVSAFIYHPFYKFVYYLFCFVCMAIIIWKPGLSAGVGLFESSINIVILSTGMMLSVYLGTITIQHVVNFVLSGGICLTSFYRCVWVNSQRSDSKLFRPWDGRL